MRIIITLLLPACLLALSSSLFSQTSKDATIPLNCSILSNPEQVVLNWSSPTATADVILVKKQKGEPGWEILLDDPAHSDVSFMDVEISLGITYEYGIQLTANGITAYGYLTVPVEGNVVDQRGTVLIVLEDALQQALPDELALFEKDLQGDGWNVLYEIVSPTESVVSVKEKILAVYTATQADLNSVLLFGNVPVPYSGNANWDGHADHQGAWPSDAFYADVDFEWTDAFVNNTTPSRPENDNVPGDGKYDHSFTPTNLELAIGRVDFSNLDEATFGTSRIELYRRYLDKNHNWRTKQYTVANKALVDDNFGYFSGEAFASNGYRLGNALVGEANTLNGDFFNDTDAEGFLVGYGCGGGTYTSAGGVGNSSQFATDSVNVVFSMLFGSYHGDWDFSPNPFMPSALASKGGILSCSWAGRPHWFYHHLAAGETLGYCALATQNSCENPYYIGTFAECGAHVSLLGDPTLRAHIVAQPQDLTATRVCNEIILNWTAANEPNLVGYHIYRYNEATANFARLSIEPISGNSFVDSSPTTGDLVYQVKAVVLQSSHSGSYFNTSTGVFVETSFQIAALPSLEIASQNIDCDSPSGSATVQTDAVQASYSWSGPNGFISNNLSISSLVAGNYTAMVTDLATGCTSTDAIEILENTDSPSLAPSADGELTCLNTTVGLQANANGGQLIFEWSGPGAFTSNDENPNVEVGGIYELLVTDLSNACTALETLQVLENTDTPNLTLSAETITCANENALLTASADMPVNSISWSGPMGFVASGDSISVNNEGVYQVEAIGLNGCAAQSTVEVFANTEQPDVSATDGELSCSTTSVQLQASSNTTNVVYEWLGPNGFSSFEQNPVVSLPGSYAVIATDTSNGCSNFAGAFVSQSDDVPQAQPFASDVLDCNTSEVTLIAAPASSAFSFLWAGPIGFVSMEENPLVSVEGIYYLTVTNPDNGCSGTFSTIVEELEQPILAISPPSLSCTFPSAFLNLVQICGQPGVDCTLIYPDTSFSTGSVFEINQIGEYHLQIFDNNIECYWVVDPFTVMGDFEAPDLEVVGDFDLPCANLMASVEAQSTYDNVIYVWTGSNFPMPNSAVQQLAPGTYTVTAETPNGCETSQQVVISSPPPLQWQLTSTLNCDGFLDPVLDFSGGTPPYSYTITPTPPIPPNTAFTIQIIDGNDCEEEFEYFNPPVEVLSIQTQHTDETVAGENDGTATVEILTGLGPFTYLWSNGETSQTISNLPPGEYNVTVTSIVNGCTSTATVNILAGQTATSEVPGLVSLQLLPNPTSGQFELRIALAQMADLQVEIIDVTGRVLQKTAFEKSTNKTWRFDVSGEAAGVFICKIRVDGNLLTRKVVKVD